VKRRRVRLVDTTLRDGEQSPGLAFSLKTKKRLAFILDRAGIHQIEAGAPAMGDKEIEAVLAVKAVCRRALVSTWNRLKLEDLEASFACRPDIVHICLPVSEIHLQKKLKISWETALTTLIACLEAARRRGREVSVGLEDVSRAEPGRLLQAAAALRELGVRRIRLSDTVGVLTPGRLPALFKNFIPAGFNVEFHAHNDLGLAEANSLRAALAGAEYIDTTLLGVGERAGNCGLANFVRLAGAAGNLALGVRLQDALAMETEAGPILNREYFMERLLTSPTAGIFY
jgi:homocitrate synthase NifV